MRNTFLCLLALVQFHAHIMADVIDITHDFQEVHEFVPKVAAVPNPGWFCDCYNSTETFYEVQPECRCYGTEFREVPANLDKQLHRITITDSDIKLIARDSFQPYKLTLGEAILGNLPLLRVIEAGTFRNIPNLRTVYISHAPQIKFLHGIFEGFTSEKFLSLRIVSTGLMELPNFNNLESMNNIMHMIDLDQNALERIPSNGLKVKAEQVSLGYNNIGNIEPFAFNGSQIAKLSLRGNRNLMMLGKDAFNGLQSLTQLDLSETSIESMPVVGLEEIEILKIEKTQTMRVIPSVYEFQNLREAYLTHPFHCCAFKYPKQHDPRKHAEYERKLRKICEEGKLPIDTGQWAARRRRNSPEDASGESNFFVSDYALGYESKPMATARPFAWHQEYEKFLELPSVGQIIGQHPAEPLQEQESWGTFHSEEITEHKGVTAYCGNISIKTSLVKCIPEPNALNPCEDIMGSYTLRISVWFVLILAVLGNLAVIVVVLFSGGEVTVPRFLMCNLSFADLCMGLYLLLIASMDLHSVGSYFNFAFDWQYSVGCQVAGFLTVFASQLSIFTLTVITMERWCAIAYAIYLTRRLRLGMAAKVMVIGWLYSIVMASLPLFGVSNYSSTSICLPMEVNRLTDQIYLISMISLNGITFILIVFCYAQIYFSLNYETRHTATSGEMTIAKKMALLVFTDFACWAPIAFFALTAIAGYPLIGVTRSKILLVFFYPLNSCANPYLYAIMTAQYRKDFFILLSRIGICKKKAKQYTITTSLNTNPIPLITRSNGTKSTTIQTNTMEDAYV